MANTSRPGLWPYKKRHSEARIVALVAADRSADTTNNHGDIYIGDPVALSSGLAIACNSAAAAYGVCVGVGSAPSGVMGDAYPAFNAASPGQFYASLADTTGVIIYVALAQDWFFLAETASALSLVVGSPADIDVLAATAHGSRTSGRSTCRLTTASDNDVRVVETLIMAEDNDTTAIYAKHVVEFLTDALKV